jgi:hypothetical protein
MRVPVLVVFRLALALGIGEAGVRLLGAASIVRVAAARETE